MLFAVRVSSLYVLYCFFPSAMPPIDLAPFLIYTPQKKPILMIKYELSTSCHWCFLSWVQLHQQMGSAIAG